MCTAGRMGYLFLNLSLPVFEFKKTGVVRYVRTKRVRVPSGQYSLSRTPPERRQYRPFKKPSLARSFLSLFEVKNLFNSPARRSKPTILILVFVC